METVNKALRSVIKCFTY